MSLFSVPRNTLDSNAKDDPLRPLRTMADRVGKEVQEFAERVDHWHSHGNENAKAKYKTTLHMVDQFREYASSRVKELRASSDAQHKGDLDQSTRRRIQSMAKVPNRGDDKDKDKPFDPIFSSIESSVSNHSVDVQELRQWQAEFATWDLVYTLIIQYHPEPGTNVEAVKRSQLDKIGTIHRYSSNTAIWDRFLLEDDQAKEKEVVLRWLERIAKENESDIGSITSQLETESGKGTHTWTSGWLDTKSRIKQARRMKTGGDPLPEEAILRTTDNLQDLVTRLDPDAPSRQHRTIEKSDEYYERALWMMCYEMLRRGVPWHEINEWCKDRNEAWRGVSIGVAQDAHSNGSPNLAGPTVGYLFRRMCLYACRGAASPYEAAVYGILSGDLKEVEPVCRSWDDHLYARYNALLLSRFDEYLVQNHADRVPPTLARKFVFRDAVADFGDWETSSAQVVDLLKQHKVISTHSNSPIKLVQGAIISKTVGELVYHVGQAISTIFQKDDRPTKLIIDLTTDMDALSSITSNERRTATTEKHYSALANDPTALRILVHVFIALRKGLGQLNMEEFTDWDALDNVLVTYIELLRNTRRIFSIPVYAAQLNDDRPVHCLARVIPGLHNANEQKQMVGLMDVYDIDPVKVISLNFNVTVSRVFPNQDKVDIPKFELLQPFDEPLWPGKRIKSEFSGLDITKGEEELIEALKWYLHLDKDINDTFKDLTKGLECLLLNGRVGAAMQLYEEVNLEAISQMKTEAYCGYSFDFMAPGSELQDPDIIRSVGQSPRSGRSSLRPSDILSQDEHEDCVTTLRDASRTYWALQQITRVIALFRDWQNEEDKLINTQDKGAIKANLKEAKDIFNQIQAVMETIFHGGLFDNSNNTQNPKLWAIQKAYLPEIIICYIGVIQAAAFFTSRELVVKAMDVATVVADAEKKWLQDIFLETGRMSELMETFALVSQAMLRLGEHDEKKKPVKKRGNRGETVKIWDLNVRN